MEASKVSLPRMQGLDWRIDVKSASDQNARLSDPTVIVDLKVKFVTEKRKIHFFTSDSFSGTRNANSSRPRTFGTFYQF